MSAVPQDIIDRMTKLRRDLHRRPELSHHESATADRIAAELDELGITYRRGVGGHGVVADIPGTADGPLIALRADIDALPVAEETGLPFASELAGVMHACGHDGHVAMLVGAAALLQNDLPAHPTRLVFQPAEETGKGARAVIEEGALEGVAAIFAGHLDVQYPAGVIVVADGPVNAASDYFTIEITGRAGHGARPHETVDAVVAAASLVVALQAIVAREVDPGHPAVVSVGRIDAGSAPNAIAGRALVSGTIRTMHPETREQVRDAVARVADAIGRLHRCHVDIDLRRSSPAVINTPEMSAVAEGAAREVVGEDGLVPLRTVNMGSEDFGRYLEHVPGCYVRIGGRPDQDDVAPAHSGRFDFDEAALATGAAWLATVARRAGTDLTTPARRPRRP